MLIVSGGVAAATFALTRAQTSAYYAHRYLLEHPGQPEAQNSYRAAKEREAEALQAVQQAEKEQAKT